MVLLPALKPAYSSAMLQHHFAWVTREADRSVVLILPQVAFLGKCDD